MINNNQSYEAKVMLSAFKRKLHQFVVSKKNVFSQYAEKAKKGRLTTKISIWKEKQKSEEDHISGKPGRKQEPAIWLQLQVVPEQDNK